MYMVYNIKEYNYIVEKGGKLMSYSVSDILEFVEENDVKFIRLAFCDIFGRLKNF